MNTIDMINPWTKESFGTIPEASNEEIKEAMDKGHKAFDRWKEIGPNERIKYLKEIRHYILNHMDDFIEGLSKDTGKVYQEALTSDIYPTLDMIKYYEKHLEKMLRPKKVKTPIVFFGKKSYIEYKPMGVVAVISPWNYPFQLAMVPVISALAAGNTVILKPSEVTPYIGLLMEKLFKRISLPKDVVQILHGGKGVGKDLIDARPDKIFFTGSVATGKKIMAEAAKHLIPVELELGGKDPMLVFEDAHIDRAVKGALWGGFTNCGQVCMSVERLYVQDKVYDRFMERLLEEAKGLTYGKGYYDDIGAMTSQEQIEIVRSHIKDALEKGARLIYGGDIIKDSKAHFQPTILTDVHHDMLIMTEETFGPVLPVMKFHTEEEAIKLANDSKYGLNASVWTQDLDKGKRVSRRIISGNCSINDVIIGVANPNLPFGGVKESGTGKYHGKEGIYTFCHQTSVILDKGKKKREVNWYPYTQDSYIGLKALVRTLHSKNKAIALLKHIVKIKNIFR